jgi:hypothetical protein
VGICPLIRPRRVRSSIHLVPAAYPLLVGSSESGKAQVDATLTALVERCLALIQNDEPQNLDLLTQLREALTDLYAALIKLPSLGIYAAQNSPFPPTDPQRHEDSGIRKQLIQRLPPDLYWSDLRPLTWETVGDRGVQLVADQLLDLRRDLMLRQRPKPPSLLRDEAPVLGGPILRVITILQELVSDLEKYQSA